MALKRLAVFVQSRVFTKGAIVVKEGDEVGGLYIVKTGVYEKLAPTSDTVNPYKI